MAKCLLVEGASDEFLDALQQLVQAYTVDLSQGMPSAGLASQKISATRLRTPLGTRKWPVTTPRVGQCYDLDTPSSSPPAPTVDMALSPLVSPTISRENTHDELEGNDIRSGVEECGSSKGQDSQTLPFQAVGSLKSTGSTGSTRSYRRNGVGIKRLAENPLGHSSQSQHSSKSAMSFGTCESVLSSFATELLGRTTTRKSRFLESIHFTIEDPERVGPLATVFYFAMPLIIMLSVAAVCFQTVHPKPIDDGLLQLIDLCLSVVLILEVTVRIIAYPNISFFFKNFSSSQVFLLIDLAAAIPLSFLIRLGQSGAVNFGQSGIDRSHKEFDADQFFSHSVVSLLRLLKMLRYLPNIHLLSRSTALLVEALPSMLFVNAIMNFVFASLLALCEPPHSVPSLSQGLIISITTMTTVGYDWTPVTTPGHLVYTVLVVVSVLYMAMPLGIIGNIFTNVWKDRDRILLMKTTRTRLGQWGYTARDIPELFSRFDIYGEGELDIFAFREMVHTMNIGFDEKRIDELFLQFDLDNSGTIDASEFVRHLFPRTFYELYGHIATQASVTHRDPSEEGSVTRRPSIASYGSDTLTATKEERESGLAARRRSYYVNENDVHSPARVSSPAQETARIDSKDSEARCLSRDHIFGEGTEVRVVKEGISKGKHGIVVGKPSNGYVKVEMQDSSHETLTFSAIELEYAHRCDLYDYLEHCHH